MRSFRVCISAVLTAVIIISMLVPAAFAAESGVDWDAVRRTVENGIAAQENFIDISGYDIPFVRENVDMLSDIVYNTPELLGVCEKYMYSNPDGRIVSLSVAPQEYAFDIEEYQNRLAECEDVIEQLLYGIKENKTLSEAEKCMLVHDRLAAWCSYDLEGFKKGTAAPESHTAYGALVSRVAVCQGYAYAYNWLVGKLGIKASYVISDQLNHGWSMVKINGRSYFVDTMWDDPSPDVLGKVNHQNLLISSARFSALHSGAADFAAGSNASDYENSYWANSETEAQYIDGKIYYLDASAYASSSGLSRSKADLNCMDPASGLVEKLKTFSYVWSSPTGIYYGCYSRLASIGKKLLFSTPNAIRSYNVETKDEEVVYSLDSESYASGQRIYGFTQHNGVLAIQTSAEPNISETSVGRITSDYCTHTDTELIASDGGTLKYICRDCRAVTEKEAGCDHQFNAWTVTKEASCVAAGEEAHECIMCGYYETRVTGIDPEKHTGGTQIRNAGAATCSENGYTGDIYCEDCGVLLEKGEEINKTGHAFGEWTETVKATCAAEGTQTRECVSCGSIENRATAPDPANHTGETEIRGFVEATETHSGYTGDTYCASCGQKLASGKTVERLIHTHSFSEWKVEKAATCIARGSEKRVCTKCGKTETRRTERNAANHVNLVVTKRAVCATCTADGRTQEIRCYDCGALITRSKAVRATGHCYTAKTVKATCTSGGYTKYTCKNCGCSYCTNKTEALGHHDRNGDCRCDCCGVMVRVPPRTPYCYRYYTNYYCREYSCYCYYYYNCWYYSSCCCRW